VREPRPSENNPTVGDQHIRIGRGYVNIKRQEKDYCRKVKGVEILSAPFFMPLIDDPNLACSRPDVLRSALAWSGSRLETIAE